MDVDLIRELKKAAIDEQCNAYEIVEAATKKWLSERAGGMLTKQGTVQTENREE